MPNVTNEVFTNMMMSEGGEEWMDLECDGCGAMLGALPPSEYNKKELYLCSHCTPDCCASERLAEVDPVKYAELIHSRKYKLVDMLFGPEDAGHCPCGSYTCDGTCDSNILF